jgi:hypothetical protein
MNFGEKLDCSKISLMLRYLSSFFYFIIISLSLSFDGAPNSLFENIDGGSDKRIIGALLYNKKGLAMDKGNLFYAHSQC